MRPPYGYSAPSSYEKEQGACFRLSHAFLVEGVHGGVDPAVEDHLQRLLGPGQALLEGRDLPTRKGRKDKLLGVAALGEGSNPHPEAGDRGRPHLRDDGAQAVVRAAAARL